MRKMNNFEFCASIMKTRLVITYNQEIIGVWVIFDQQCVMKIYRELGMAVAKLGVLTMTKF